MDIKWHPVPVPKSLFEHFLGLLDPSEHDEARRRRIIDGEVFARMGPDGKAHLVNVEEQGSHGVLNSAVRIMPPWSFEDFSDMFKPTD